MQAGTTHLVDRVGVSGQRSNNLDGLGRARSLHHRPDQGYQRDSRRRTITDGGGRRCRRCPASRKCSRWCSAAVPGRCGGFEKLRDSDPEAPAQRRQLQLRDGDVGGARLSASAGLPSACSISNHPGTLTREYDLDLITTAPSVVYRIHLTKARRRGRGAAGSSCTSADMPDPNRIAMMEEPWIEATVYVPDDILARS